MNCSIKPDTLCVTVCLEQVTTPVQSNATSHICLKFGWAWHTAARFCCWCSSDIQEGDDLYRRFKEGWIYTQILARLRGHPVSITTAGGYTWWRLQSFESDPVTVWGCYPCVTFLKSKQHFSWLCVKFWPTYCIHRCVNWVENDIL